MIIQLLPSMAPIVVTDDIINQDLSTLLPYEIFSRIRKTLKRETLIFLRDEQKRLNLSDHRI